MTTEEAVELAKTISSYVNREGVDTASPCGKLAAYVIERNTPVKPEYIGQFDWWACPSCCSTVCTTAEVAIFCAGCGLPLDWSKA